MTTFREKQKEQKEALLRARKNANNPEFKLLWNQKLLELYRQEYEKNEKRG